MGLARFRTSKIDAGRTDQLGAGQTRLLNLTHKHYSRGLLLI